MARPGPRPAGGSWRVHPRQPAARGRALAPPARPAGRAQGPLFSLPGELIASAAEQPDQHQQHHGAHHRSQEARRLAGRVEVERLAAVGGDHGADDADHDGDDDAARIGARGDDAGEDADHQADQQDAEKMHWASSYTSNVAITGTWSEAFFQSRRSTSMRWPAMAPDRAGVARMWSSRRPRLEARQSLLR